MSELKFVCPNCGDTEIQECFKDAYVYQTIVMFEDPDDTIPEVEGTDFYGGSHEGFHCRTCDWRLPVDGSADRYKNLQDWLSVQECNLADKLEQI